MSAGRYALDELELELSRAAHSHGEAYWQLRAQVLERADARLLARARAGQPLGWREAALVAAWSAWLDRRSDCEAVEKAAFGEFQLGYGPSITGRPAVFDRVERIVRMGAGVTPRVVELLFWERPWSYVETSEALTGALARLGDPRAVEPLRELLTTASEPRIRRACADALGQGSFREAWDVLVRGMDDPVEEVRLACARALGRLRDERSAPALVAMLSRDDISADLKGVAMRALAKTAGDLAATTLARYIDVGAAVELVMDAIDALARTDSSTAIPVLEGLLDHPTPAVRPAAARGLERLRRRLGAS